MQAVEVDTEAVEARADLDSPPQQHAWTFFHEGEGPLATLGAYELRSRLKAALSGWPALETTVRESAKVVSLIARTPAAHQYMASNVGPVIGAMARIAGRTVAMDARCLTPGVQFKGRHLYYLPAFVVLRARKGIDWGPWQSAQLGQEQLDSLTRQIETDLTSELRRWRALGDHEQLDGVKVIDGGRPMGIVRQNGPRGMARLGVRFVAPWALDGSMFAGLHTLLGHGIVHRGGQLGNNAEGLTR